jgi:large repetitive protein
MQPIRKLLLLAILFAAAAPARASFTTIPVVQSAQGVITTTCAFASNVTSGNLVIVASVWKSSTSTPSVSDTRSSTWTQNFIDTTPTVKVAVYSTTLGSSGADTITFTVSGETAENVECVELKPKWTLTVDASGDSTWSGTPGTVTSPSLTPTLNDDLYFSILSGNGNGGNYSIQTSDQVLGLDADSSTAFGIKLAGAQSVAVTSTYTATANTATGTVAAILYKSTSGITMQSPTALPDAGLSQTYQYCLQATGGNSTYTWSITSGSLQAGLSLNTSTGCISGTPTSGPTNTLTFHVTDGTNSADLTSATLKVSASLNTPTVVQSKAASSSTVVFSSNVTSGNLILVSRSDNFGTFPNGLLGLCTDTLGTSFQILVANHPDVGQQFDSVYYAGIAPSTGADTVNCHVSSASDVWSAEEISNVGNFGNLNANITQGSSASPITSNSLTTLSYGMLLVGNGIGFTSTATLAIQSPFTAFTANANPNEGYEVVTTATGYTVSFTETSNTNGHWSIALLAFWPTGGAAASGTTARHQIIDR